MLLEIRSGLCTAVERVELLRRKCNVENGPAWMLDRSRIMFGRQPSRVVFLYKLTPLLLQRLLRIIQVCDGWDAMLGKQ
ncbi:hypothetical protein E2C01_008443 [Portunus trituberculatus]|uniref:Uncharacterized protein n=1 Tax=Portunus trituberculatus TaxID=210409 RepID=A0A5B7D409_PORTR|nr:hypothetical protein [Portunus trituberculatus]